MRAAIDRFFGLTEHNSSIRQEVLAGVTTFLAMAYITVVNPGILSAAGMDFGAVFVATCLAAALGTAIMGLYANYPVAQAPGMGQNAFFTYGVVLGLGHTWQSALGAVFVSGLIFILLSVLPIREWLINAIPRSLKLGISAGIGLFLGIIALTGSGIIVSNEATIVGLGDLTKMPAIFMILGFVLIAALSARRTVGAVVIGMLVVTVLGWLTGAAEFKGFVSMPPPMTTFLELDIVGALDLSMVTVILTLLLVDVFDTAGTLVGVANRAGMLDERGHLPRLRRALLSDSSATAVGALLGTSSTTSFIESAAGVEAGGRTGLTALTTAGLFLLCLFMAPLAQSVPGFATGAALLFVATIMARALEDLEWGDVAESAPAIITAIAVPLSYSIADGIGLGFITYALIKIASGHASRCPMAVYVVAGIFMLKFGFLS
ncbi:MAG: AGZA family xanthine/uracil permease-like MFS transporter [Glaciecola sp.]|jgi:AGZA family xanthine/uracil permease-like MFS transporter|uniref:NCS2 family permease n=1 Tax=Congregibacter sp. TaxID=2744308 RepID=UPI0039E5315A